MSYDLRWILDASIIKEGDVVYLTPLQHNEHDPVSVSVLCINPPHSLMLKRQVSQSQLPSIPLAQKFPLLVQEVSSRRHGNETLPALKSSHVEALRAIFINKGHSRHIAKMMTQLLRESSLRTYNGHWKRFVAYCENKGLNVFNVRLRHFSKYCLDLFDNDYKPGTIISHRTSIASVLHHWNYDPTNDLHITLMLRSFRLAKPVELCTMPEWDLQVFFFCLAEAAICQWGSGH